MVKIRKRKLVNGGYSLGLDIYQKGKRKYFSLNLHLTGDKLADRQTMEAAEKIRKAKEIELSLSAAGIITAHESSNFLDYCRERMKVKGYYARLSSVVQILSNYTNNYLPWSAITLPFIERFINYLRNDLGRKEHTVYTDIGLIRSILNSAKREGLIQRNPIAELRMKKPKLTRQFLTGDDLKRLADTLFPHNPRIKDMFFFAVNTGLRLGDLKQLRYEDIVDGKVTIRMDKTNNDIIIPLNTSALKYLGTGRGIVFKNFPAPGTLSKYMAIWRAAAGVNKPVTMHIARHTFATMLLTTGADVTVVRDLLGHSDIRTTLIYAKIVDERKVSAVMNLPEI